MSRDPSASSEHSPHLRSGTLGAFAVGAMAMAFAAPSVSIFFNSPFAAASAGKTMPLAFLVSGLAVLMVAWCISSFARKIPTSGYSYSFVSHGMGSRMGFLSGWGAALVFLGNPFIVPPVFGITMSDLARRTLGLELHWAICGGVMVIVVMVIGVLGIQESLRTGAVFLGLEVAVLSIFGLFLLLNGGPEGRQVSPFEPNAAPSLGGLAVGLVFGILSFGGFESAATLGEETREPRILVPRAMIWAVATLALLYTFVAYAVTVGWGPSHMASYASGGTPLVVLAQEYGGDWLVRVFEAIVCAGLLAGFIASMNAGARVLFAMGREHMLPTLLASLHRKRRTPWVAILLPTTIGGVVGLTFGTLWNPMEWWGFVSTVLALVEIFVYVLVSLSVCPFYYRFHRSEFSLFVHVVVPFAATTVMLLPLAIPGGLLYPVPTYPFNLPPYLALAWITIGGIILLWLGREDPERLRRAGKAVTNPERVS